MPKQMLVGGSFAPPITEAHLLSYTTFAENAERRVREYMLDLIKMLRTFWETGESQKQAVPGPLGLPIVPLEDAEIERIWDFVPWPEECDAMGRVFSSLPPGDRRNAAFHLLWYARELAADREPTTTDRINLQ